jgi:enoyl-CoA hydratase/carnithine racemase
MDQPQAPPTAGAGEDAGAGAGASAAPLRVQRSGGVARLIIDNGPINLLDRHLFKALRAEVAALAEDPSVRVVVLASANPAWFIAHFDVSSILRMPPDAPAPTGPDGLSAFQALCECLRTMPKATIAVIEGRAGGGGSELALACDMRFALQGAAIFNQPEVALGILPGGGGTVHLPRLLGRGRAMEVVLGCDDVSAEEAQAWGWVNRCLPAAALWPHVDRLAARIASYPAHAVAAAKASVLRATPDVKDHLRAEGQAFQGTLGGAGTQAAMQRFLAEGGQTAAGEARLGALVAELAARAREK